jgi:hypothetical protein
MVNLHELEYDSDTDSELEFEVIAPAEQVEQSLMPPAEMYFGYCSLGQLYSVNDHFSYASLHYRLRNGNVRVQFRISIAVCDYCPQFYSVGPETYIYGFVDVLQSREHVFLGCFDATIWLYSPIAHRLIMNFIDDLFNRHLM